MDPPTDLLGATWFIRSLFFAAVIIDISLYILRKVRNAEYYLLAVFFAIAVWMKSFPPGTPVIRQLALIFYGGTFFLMGCCFRDLFSKLSGKVLTLPICIVLLVFETVLAPNTVLKVNGAWNSILYFFEAIPGILMMLVISSYIDRLRTTGNALSYIGQNTRVILFLHFTAFIAVNALIVSIKDLDRSLITSFPVVHTTGCYWWILYTVAGTAFPLLLKFLSVKLRPKRK